MPLHSGDQIIRLGSKSTYRVFFIFKPIFLVGKKCTERFISIKNWALSVMYFLIRNAAAWKIEAETLNRKPAKIEKLVEIGKKS